MATIESAVYTFEGLLPDLESPPIAARRALDHAGYRLSVEGWRSLSPDERQRVTFAGVPDRVDVDVVVGLLRRANPGPQRITPVSDPDPSAPPEALAKALEPTRVIDPKRWARLRAIDRYALAHTYRRAVARSAFSILGDAFDAVLAASAPVYDNWSHQTGSQPVRHGYTPTAPPTSPVPPSNTYQPAGYYSSHVSPGTPPEAREAAPPAAQHRPSQYPGALTYDAPAPPKAPTFPAPYPMSAQVTPSGPPAEAVPAGRGYGTYPPPGGVLSNHLTQAGEVHMVDVARKPKTERRAIARGSVLMRPDTLARLVGRDAPKGEVLATARVAAILAAKRTHELVPLCHQVALTHLEVIIEIDPPGSRLHVTAVAEAYDRTGCEMEAMVAVSHACLTIYDMLKGIDRDVVIADVKLMEKSGGRSGHYRRAEAKP